MRQVLSRFASSVRQRFVLPKEQLEKRLALVSAFLGTWVITWLLPKVAAAAPTGNAATDAQAAAGAASQAGGAVVSGLTTGPIMGPLAEGASYIFNMIATVIAALLYIVIYALIFVNTLITDLMIRVAQYNNFVNAKPVQMGWPLVRDVCNMFFIVILLVIAFSTIIGYKPFHFKDNLPRLLLYAVLINFSKTLIGLLIDFSQVVMLTFVVGFKDAAFGNFAKAFQIPSLLSLGQQATGGSAALPTTTNIIVALLFGIWIMTIAMTALVIMLIYFIARIIGLWVLLILSPLAFFALGVPGKVQSALSPVSSFWKQLSAWLTGGPVVAFFLWLALAVIQSSESPFADVGGVGRNAQEEAAVQAVITDIGKPENILNFIVSVAFMLIGVKTAVEVSQQANPYLGKLASDLKSGGGVAWKGAKAAYGAGRAGAQRAGQAVSYVAPKSLLQNINAKAGESGVGAALLRGSGVAGLASSSLQAKGLREDEKKKVATKKVDDSIKGLSEQDAANRLRAIGKSEESIFDRSKRVKNFKEEFGLSDPTGSIADEKLAMLTVSKNGSKALGKQFEAENDGNKNWKALNKDQKSVVKSAEVKKMQAERLNDIEGRAQAEGNDELLDKIKDERKKDPGLMSYAKLGSEIGGLDPKDIKADAWGDSAVFLAYAKDRGLIDDKTGKFVPGYKDSNEWKAIASGNGNAAKLVRAHAAELETPEGQARAVSMMGALNGASDEASIKAANDARRVLGMSGDRKQVYGANWVNQDLQAGRGSSYAEIAGESRRVSDFRDLSSKWTEDQTTAVRNAYGNDQARLDGLAGHFTSSGNADQARAIAAAAPAIATAQAGGQYDAAQLGQIYTAQTVGVSPAALGVYKEGENVSFEGELAINNAFAKAFEDAGSGDYNRQITAAQFMANIDQTALRTGGAPAEKITAAFAGSLRQPNALDNFKEAFNRASGKQQQAIESRIRDIVTAAEKARGKSGASRSGFENEAIRFQEQLMASGDKEMKRLAKGARKKN